MLKIFLSARPNKVFINAVVCSFFIMSMSCNEKKDSFLAKDIRAFSNFPEVDTIAFSNLFEHKYGGIERFILKDSLLISFNNHGKSRDGNQFTSYNLSNFESISFFPFGKGPCEVLGAQIMGIQDDRFWTYDITAKKFLFKELKDIIPGDTVHGGNCEDLSLKKDKAQTFELAQGVLVNDTTYVCILNGNNLKNKLAKIKLPSIDIIKEYGSFNMDYDNKMFSLNRKAYIERSFFFAKPDDNNVVALAYFFTDKFEVFNLEKNESSVFWGPHNIKNEFDVSNNINALYPLINDKTQVTYVGGYATERYLYLIYSGNYFRERHTSKGLSLTSKSIYVFDWTGKPIKELVWKENISLSAIAISKNENVLYGFDQNTNYVVSAKLE